MSVRATGAVGAALLVLCAGGLAGSASAGDQPTTIGVRNGQCEFSFVLSRTRVRPGPAIIQYSNTCEDPHDVLIKRKGSKDFVAIGETGPGDVSTFPVMKLKRDSRYILWCSLDGHRESGMEAALKVRKRR